MLETQLKQSDVLRKLFDSIKDIITQANIECRSTGMKMFTIDEQHISIVEFYLNADGFERYRCDRTVTLGIQLESLMKILRCGTNDDSVILRADDNGDTLNLVFESEKQDRVSEFDLKLISLSSQCLEMAANSYDAVVTMSSSELVRVCRDLKNFSDSVVIEVAKDSVRFGVTGDVGKASVLLKTVTTADADSETAPIKIEVKSPVSCSLSLKHVVFYTKAAALSESVKISISNQYPAKFEFQMPPIGYLNFYLAPKIDAEE